MAALLLFLLLLFYPFHASAQNNNGTVSVGASITAGVNDTRWLSPSGDFAFGFQTLPDNPDLFVLAIWFDKIPNRTIVWYDTGSFPVNRGGSVRLDAADGIVVQGPRGQVLSSTQSLDARVTIGFMNDTGNFVLLGGRGEATRLWESFKHPTDTILPGQSIDSGGQLISRRTPANFSEGRFYARMTSDGDFMLSTKRLPSNTHFEADYYNTETSTNAGYQVVFDDRGLLCVVTRSGQLIKTLSSRSNPSTSDNYYRASLDPDGVFAQYYHPKNFDNNPGWITEMALPENICLSINGDNGSGACGYNSVCSIQNRRPVCKCPRNFLLADPSNPYGDCLPNYVQMCVQGDQPVEGFDLVEISDTDWPMNDYQQIDPSTEDECRSLCMNDCFCGAAIFRNNICWKKKLPLANGRIDTVLHAKAFLKFKKADTLSVNPNRTSSHDQPKKDNETSIVGSGQQPKKDNKTFTLVGSLLLGSSVFINCLFISAGCIGFFLVYKKKFPAHNPHQNKSGPSLRCFTYKELLQATREFKQELGRGAFAIVYKGVMSNEYETAIAVKKLDRVFQDSEKEFRTEVNVIGKTHHKNLVRLIGFCDEGPHRLLVYEYMSNGTIADFLFGDNRPSWSQRTQIAMGVARGLTYLHEECSTQIIHCDIKPQNVLLDEHYNARISDFGLAKLLMMNQSKTVTNIRGTKGYIAPEWFRNAPVSIKADVYSFGVLLLEIVTCKKSLLVRDLEFGESGEEFILTDWVWDCFVEGRTDTLVLGDAEALSDRNTLERFVIVGIWCIQEDPSMRPTMRNACQMLEGIVDIEMPPCPYTLFNTTS